MARGALRAGAVLLPVAAVLALGLRGVAGAVTAAGTVLFISLIFAGSGYLQAWAARQGLATLQLAALGGFGVRLALYATLIVALSPVEAIDGHVLAITGAATIIALLAYEVRLAMTHPEFWWVRAGEEHA